MGGKYQAYPEYQDSGIEILSELPVGWRALRGKLVFSEYSERSESGEETLLSVSEYYGVKPRGEVIDEGDFLSRAESLVGYKKCEKHDLVMNIMLAWKRGLGVTKFAGIVSPAYSVFRFNENADPDYMHYLLRTDVYVGHFKTRSTGVIDSRLRLYPESFGNVPIILPPIDQQRRIANFLDHETAKIDTLIEKQQQLIKLLKGKRQAVISHAVTKGLNPDASMRDSGVEWLGEVPAHWVAVKVKHVVREIIDAEHKTAEFFDDGEYLVCRTTNVKDGKLRLEGGKYTNRETFLEWTKRGLPEEGDILFTREAPAGEACLVPTTPTLCLGQRMVLFKVIQDRVIPRFLLFTLYAGLADDFIKQLSQGSTVAHLNMADIKNIPLLEPPIIEQEQIVEYLNETLSKYDNLIQKAEESIYLSKERCSALISAAVTGEIDIREWKAPGKQEAA